MNSSNFISTVKSNIRVVNLLLFALTAFFWLLPFYSFYYYGYGGSISAFTYIFRVNFLGILMLAAPIFGLVYLFVLSGGKTSTQHAMYLGAAHLCGFILILLFGAWGFGAILSLLAFAAGAAANGIVLFTK